MSMASQYLASQQGGRPQQPAGGLAQASGATQQQPQQNIYGTPMDWNAFSNKYQLHTGTDQEIQATIENNWLNKIKSQEGWVHPTDLSGRPLTDQELIPYYSGSEQGFQGAAGYGGLLQGAQPGGTSYTPFRLPKGINPADFDFIPMYGGTTYQLRPKSGQGQSYYLHGKMPGAEGFSTLEGFNRASNRQYWNQDWINQSGLTPEQMTTAGWVTPTGDTSGYAGDIWSTSAGRLNQLGRAGNHLDDDDRGWQLTAYDPVQERIRAGFRSDDSGTIFDYTAPKQTFMDKYGDQIVLAVIGAMAGGAASAAMGGTGGAAAGSGAAAGTGLSTLPASVLPASSAFGAGAGGIGSAGVAAMGGGALGGAAGGWAGALTPYLNSALTNMGTNAVTQYLQNGNVNWRNVGMSGLTGAAGQFMNNVGAPWLKNTFGLSPSQATYLARAGTNVAVPLLQGRRPGWDALISPLLQYGSQELFNDPRYGNWLNSGLKYSGVYGRPQQPRSYGRPRTRTLPRATGGQTMAQAYLAQQGG